MIATSTMARSKMAGWQGSVRFGPSSAACAESRDERRVELGAATFLFPDPGEAKTTSRAHFGRLFCVFTGHLYNRAELQKELLSSQWAPGAPGSVSPAGLVLEGYRQLGCEILKRLEGMFACAVWDQSNQLLLCGRDPMGLHPFYYSRHGDELVFSWDIQAVLRHPRVSRELNRVVLAEHLGHRWMDAGETFFSAVRRLPGAHGLKIAGGRLEIFRYWDPAPPGRPINWLTEDELTQLPDLIRNAVERTMECGRTGIFLSGGLDSISVGAWASEVAAERGWDPPRAFSVIFPGTRNPEEWIQRAVGQKLGFPHSFASLADYLNGTGITAQLLGCSAAFPAPLTHLFMPPYIDLLSQAKKQGCEVVLTGEGGDEWLTVTPALAADLIRTGRFIQLSHLVRTGVRCWHVPARLVVRNVLWTYGLRTLARDWVWTHAPGLALRRRRRFKSVAIPAWMAPGPALRRQLEERFELWERQTCQDSFYLMAVREAFTHPLHYLSVEERFFRDALVGIPTLHPYWDRPVVDFLLRTPPRLLNVGARSKAPVRKMMAERFPQLGFERQKKEGTTELCKEIYRREGPMLWQGLGPPRLMAELGLVDASRFRDMLPRWLEQNTLTSLHRIWHTASVETWVRGYAG